MSIHPTIFNSGVAPFWQASTSMDAARESLIGGQCVSPPTIVIPKDTKTRASSEMFNPEAMKRQWGSTVQYPDIRRTRFNVMSSMVELKLRLLSDSQLDRATYIPSAIELRNILVSPFPNSQWCLPFLFASTFHDLGYTPTNPEIFNNEVQKKVWSLADKFDINAEKALCTNVIPWFNGQWYWHETLMGIRPYWTVDNLIQVRGRHSELLENWCIVVDEQKYTLLPLTAVTDCIGNHFPLFLPRSKYHLAGLDFEYIEEKQKYVITPSYTDWLANSGNSFGGVVVTWLGGAETVELVDWSPLYNRSVVYVVDATTFGGNVRACLQCMETVCKKLADNGCRITLCCPTL